VGVARHSRHDRPHQGLEWRRLDGLFRGPSEGERDLPDVAGPRSAAGAAASAPIPGIFVVTADNFLDLSAAQCHEASLPCHRLRLNKLNAAFSVNDRTYLLLRQD
jgi:hypothetical protein